MSKITFTGLALLSVLFFGNASGIHGAQPKQNISDASTGTLQKMIVENGSVTMNLDLNGLNGSNALITRPVTLQFAAATNSFFPILIFNDQLRAAEPGSMALIPAEVDSVEATVPAAGMALLQATRLPLQSLVVEKLPLDQRYDLAVRDSSTGFTFFNVEGGQYDYDANAQTLSVTDGRLLISKEFANALGRPSDTGALVGKISVGAAMQPIEIDQVVNGELKSAVMPAVGTQPGPDVIVGDLSGLAQFDNAVGTQVGLAVATDSCNRGQVDLDWFALPNNDHPVIPQNLYRMSGGGDNTQRFEQIGQSSCKHAFTALTNNLCGFGCNGVGGSHLGSGCSDPYSASLNSGGSGHNLGSRAWINPFTGFFPRGDSQTPPNNHTGHVHTDVSHRIIVEINDLNTTQNPGATYFAEAQYVTPHEYAWCQSNPGQCNMYNNASYRQYSVTGINPPFSFSPVASTVPMQPAITAWTGATVNQIEPDPGNDGMWFMGYKVTNPTSGVWHYEYALYNQNLDRAIQSFSVPLGPGVNISNIGFHAPPQHPGWGNDGTQNDQGYSSTPWNVTQIASSITWNTETFAQNQNANAIRWGTLYNLRFDANQPPQAANATVGFFKTGSPITVAIQAPVGVGTPTPTPTASPTPTATATATATPTPLLTPTPTPTATPTGAPIVTTNPATNVASFSATLNGAVNPHGLTTTVRFQYGTTTSYGSTTANQTKTGSATQNVAANISGLTANTTYHFRIVATNSSGTSFGADQTFTTTGPPVVTTNPATNVARRSAKLNGTVNPNGLATTVRFQYGRTTSYRSTTANQTNTGTTAQNVAANISGLRRNTTYHFRMVATNGGGTTYGSDKTLRTRR